MDILMVCLGNICRSPMAEGVMRNVAVLHGLQIHIQSCGTQGYHSGECPDPRAIKAAASHHVDISKQRARMFVANDFERFDLILAMDNKNRLDILKQSNSKAHQAKVRLFLSVLNDPQVTDVPDPYYGSADDFELVYQLCTRAAEAWCIYLLSQQGRNR